MRPLFLISIAAAILANQAQAQLVADSNAPIDITGDAAEFQEGQALWTGNVRVVQGEAVLTSQRLEAELNEEGDFEKIIAIGSVRYSNGTEAITGRRGVYDAVTRTITMFEDVLVTQGKQVLAAGKVVYWIDSGKVRFFPRDGERIRGIFYTETDGEQS